MLTNHHVADERRRFKRFKVRQESSFVMTASWPTPGKLVDISQGGLAFVYSAEEKWSTEQLEGGMLFGGHDSCLSDIPMRIVADHVVEPPGEEDFSPLRRRCVAFGDLSDEQRFLLECFIWVNGVVEC